MMILIIFGELILYLFQILIAIIKQHKIDQMIYYNCFKINRFSTKQLECQYKKIFMLGFFHFLEKNRFGIKNE